MKVSDIRERAGSQLWLWPLTGLVITAAVAIGTLYADATLNDRVSQLMARFGLVASDFESARTILSVIATAMMSLLVFTFATTMVVVQLASAQYSPRLMRSVLRDRYTKVGLTAFISGFALAIIVLRGLAADKTQVPELSILVTWIVAIACLLVFVIYINHVVHSLRVGTVIDRVTDETIEMIGKRSERVARLRDIATERPAGDQLHGGHVLESPERGAVAHIDEQALLALAEESDLLIEVLHGVGDHVPKGSPLVRVYGDGEHDEVLDQFSVAPSRTMQQDIAFGMRQLVDIANRALSPGINDPTTAVQCIDGLHDLLHQLLGQPDLPEAMADGDGHCRLIIPRTGWDDYLALAVTEVRIYGSGTPQIPRRLQAMLRDLLHVAPPRRRRALEHQLELLSASVKLEVELSADRTLFQTPDDQGLGRAHGGIR